MIAVTNTIFSMTYQAWPELNRHSQVEGQQLTQTVLKGNKDEQSE